MCSFESRRLTRDYTGRHAESPTSMYLRRKKDPGLSAQAVIMQKKLIGLIRNMKAETPEGLQEVEELLKSGVDTTVPDYSLNQYFAGKNFYSPLHYAVNKGFSKVARLLLNYNANASAKDRYSVTPMHLAADVGSEECLELLIEYGAEVNTKTQLLLRNCKDAYAEDRIVRDGKWPDLEEFSFSVLPYELGTTPILIAARKNHIKCMIMLMDQGADYNAADEKGQTSLYLAAKAGLPDCVMALLKNAIGLPILSIPTKSKDTALHECLRHGKKMTECIKELIRHGSDVSFANEKGETAVHLAVSKGFGMDVFMMLMWQGYGMDFDRLKFFSSTSGVKRRDWWWKDTPLAQVSCWSSKARTMSNREELGVLFLRLGAARTGLKDLLMDEFRSSEPVGPFFETLMDSVAYLPLPPAHVHVQVIAEEEDSDEDDIDDGALVQQLQRALEEFDRQRPRYVSSDLLILPQRHRAYPTIHDYGPEITRLMCLAHRRLLTIRTPENIPLRQIIKSDLQKQRYYVQRCQEIPSLAHLSRIAIRTAMQANVRSVITLPIPTPVKEYILLGFPLTPRGYKQGEGDSSAGGIAESDTPEAVTAQRE